MFPKRIFDIFTIVEKPRAYKHTILYIEDNPASVRLIE